MNKPLVFSLTSVAFAFLSQGAVNGQTVTLLESFEDGVEGVDHHSDDPANQRITAFEQSDDNDLDQVTHGENALLVKFDSMRGWSQDFKVLLSPEATVVLEEVVDGLAETPEIGRFFIMYDITWDKLEADASWANNPMNFSGHGTGHQVEWGGGGRPVLMEYDLGAGLPEGWTLGYDGENGDQAFLRFIFNANTDMPMNVYVDNIRIMDTKPPGAETTVTLLDSFEENLDALLAIGTRTEGPEVNEDEFFVTEGSKSAKFNLGSTSGWGQDFSIELGLYDELNAVLEMEPEERLSYSVAWDWIPELGDATATWFQESLNNGIGVTAAWNSDGNVKTRVINLGLTDWFDIAPTMQVVHNSNWNGGDMTIYMDNVRLINTAAGATEPDSFEITEVTRSSEGEVSLTWTSVEGGVYAVDSSADLQKWGGS